MTEPFATVTLRSFDRSSAEASKVYYPDRYRRIERVFAEKHFFAVRGAGLSYPPLSFGGGSVVVDLGVFDRFISFDTSAGIVEVESGMTLGKLAELAIKHNWYLGTQPGHPQIQIGGCVASDVHGKNQFSDGNFKDQVLFLTVYHPHHGFIKCSRNENEELFHLTCGGWGLTGVIVTVALQLEKLESPYILSNSIAVPSFKELPELLLENSSLYSMLYSWHDLESSRHWGKGFLKVGQFDRDAGKVDLSNDIAGEFEELNPIGRGYLVCSMLNNCSLPMMNRAYAYIERPRIQARRESIYSFMFPVARKTFYFSLFGRPGFHESQVLVPFEEYESVIQELKKGVKKFKQSVALASCKLFSGKPDLLRFQGPGIVIALNIPRTKVSPRFLEYWDEIVMGAGATPNLTKDSRVPLRVVKKCYSEYDLFKDKLLKWDPARLFQNALSKRLEL